MPVLGLSTTSNSVDTPYNTSETEPLLIPLGIKVAATPLGKEAEDIGHAAITVLDLHLRQAVAIRIVKRSYDGNLRIPAVGKKEMLLTDRTHAPPGRPVELRNVVMALVAAKTVYTVYVARVALQRAVESKLMGALNRLENRLRCEQVEVR
jgi:hypothetical protein